MGGKFLILGIAMLFMISMIMPSINGGGMKPIPEYRGRTFFGFVAIGTAQADAPYNYKGVLINANIILYGPNTTLIVIPFPFMLVPNILQTNDTVYLHIGFFKGAIENVNNSVRITGYALMTIWRWGDC